MFCIAIVEDDLRQMKLLREYLDQYAQKHGYSFQVSCYFDGDAITRNYQNNFDIILMDIDLPFMNGYAAAQMIRNQDPEVVILFITNLTQYAIKGYSVGVLDYILKPVTFFSFSEFMNRAIERAGKRPDAYITISQSNGIQKLAVSEIYYVESRDHYLFFCAKSGTYRVRGKISDAEAQLGEHGFLRCHMSYLINPRYVNGYRKDQARVGEAVLPVSRSRKKIFFQKLIDYMNK